MNFKQMLNLKDINMRYLVAIIAFNIFWTLSMAAVLTIFFMQELEGSPMMIQLGLTVATFLGPFLSAWLLGTIAADGREMTYGLYGGIASAVLLLVLAVPSTGLFGLMLMLVALSGGLNGGLMTARRR